MPEAIFMILFIIRSTRTFHYHRSIIAALCKQGHIVRVLFDYEWSKTKVGALDMVEAFKKNEKNFSYEWALRRNDFWKKIINPFREIRSYRRYIIVEGQSDYYRKRWLGYTSGIFQRAVRFFPGITHAILRTDVLGKILKKLEAIIPPADAISKHLQSIRPALVLASPVNMRHSSSDLEYVKAANHLKILTAVQVISWDNLTTKGIFHVFPDILLVWNEVQKKEAMKHHDIPPERIRITGAPVFDDWFGTHAATSREDFCRKWRLRSEDPILLYLGSTKNIARDESWVVEKIDEAFRNAEKEQLWRTQIIVRPHPAHFRIYERLHLPNVSIVPRQSTAPNSEDSMQLFYDSVFHADATFGINTSGMIDAIIAGSPGITMIVEEYSKTQEEAVHFNHLLEGDVLDIAKDFSDIPKIFEHLRSGGDTRKEKRDIFIKNFIRPRGLERSAGSVAAEEVIKMINRCA